MDQNDIITMFAFVALLGSLLTHCTILIQSATEKPRSGWALGNLVLSVFVSAFLLFGYGALLLDIEISSASYFRPMIGVLVMQWTFNSVMVRSNRLQDVTIEQQQETIKHLRIVNEPK